MQAMFNGGGFILRDDLGTEKQTQGYDIEGTIVFPIHLTNGPRHNRV
jgi:hypothetical protein